MSVQLEEFIVSLGAKIDKASFDRFHASLKGLKTAALGLGVTFAGLAAGIVKVADSWSRMGYEARNAGSSVTQLNSMIYAVKQLGGSGQEAAGALNHIGNMLRYGGPGVENMIRSWGVATRKSNGNFRDTVDILTDLAGKWKQLSPWQARAEAQALGISDNLLTSLLSNPQALKERENEFKDIYRRLGIDPNEAARDSQMLMTQFNRLMVAIEAIGQKLALSLIHAFGGKDLNDFTNYLLAHSDEIAQSIKQISDLTITTLSSIGQIARGIGELVDKTTGWKTVLEGVFALFIGSKVFKVLRVLFGVGRGFAALAGAGAEVAAGTVSAPVAAVAAAGFGGYEAYEHWDSIKKGYHDLKNWWYGNDVAKTGARVIVDKRLLDHWQSNPFLSNEVKRRQLFAMNWLVSQGLTPAQAAGLVGNFTRESLMGINSIGDNGEARGLAQWHPDRQAAIYRALGIDVTTATLPQQLKAALYEWRENIGNNAHGFNELLQAKTVQQAAAVTSNLFERPRNATGEEAQIRAWYGKQALQAYNAQHVNFAPSQVNNISVKVSSGNPQEIAQATSTAITDQWKGTIGNHAPRQLGIIGRS